MQMMIMNASSHISGVGCSMAAITFLLADAKVKSTLNSADETAEMQTWAPGCGGQSMAPQSGAYAQPSLSTQDDSSTSQGLFHSHPAHPEVVFPCYYIPACVKG